MIFLTLHILGYAGLFLLKYLKCTEIGAILKKNKRM